MKHIDLHLHYSRLNSSFFTRVALSYIFLLIIVILTAITSISIGSLRLGNLDFYNLNDIEDEYDESRFNTIEVTIRRGDNFTKILNKQPITADEKKQILVLSGQVNIDSNLHVGKKITFEYDRLTSEEGDEGEEEFQTLKQITYQIDNSHRIEITKRDKNIFFVKNQHTPLNKLLVKHSLSIKNSLIESFKQLEIPLNNLLEIVNVYGHRIDFRRNLKDGDEVDIIAEKYYAEDGEFSHYGKIIFASLNISGKRYNIYRYSPNNDNKYQYFSEDAKIVKGNLLKDPLKIAKVNSHYGRRVHPIDGYIKMHTGVDYSAPTGTPILAAGDGIVEEIGPKGGYGKYIKIQHNDTLSTAYAHALKFAKDLKKGSFVKQGQIIAYVGYSGHASGPHLHFETLINGRHTNPLSLKTAPQSQLFGTKLSKFEEYKNRLNYLNISLSNGNSVKSVASADISSKRQKKNKA